MSSAMINACSTSAPVLRRDCGLWPAIAVKPFGVRRPSARPKQFDRVGPVQQQRASLVVVRSFDGDASKALKEAAALDELIDTLLAAKTQQEVRHNKLYACTSVTSCHSLSPLPVHAYRVLKAYDDAEPGQQRYRSSCRHAAVHKMLFKQCAEIAAFKQL